MPLFLLRSAMLRRLWLATRLLLVSFFRRSCNVSVVCPCPLGRPATLLERSGRKLQEGRRHIFSRTCWMETAEQSEPAQTEHRLYPFLCCMAALRASARSLSTAGSCTNWSLFTALWNKRKWQTIRHGLSRILEMWWCKADHGGWGQIINNQTI